MANTRRNAKTWALAGLFKRINLGEDLKLLRSEASQLAKNIDPNDIVGAEQTEHAKIRIDLDNLVALITSFNEIRLEDFKTWLITIVQRLSPIMLEHFSYEDDLLCPISLVVIDDVKVWKSIKALCDEIGY